MTETRESFVSRTQLWGVSHAAAAGEGPRETVSVVRIQPVGAAAGEPGRAPRLAAGSRTQPGLAPSSRRKGPPPLPRKPRPCDEDDQEVTVLAAGVALPRPGRSCIIVPSPGAARALAPRGWRAHATGWLQRVGLSPVEALTAVTGLWLLIVLTVGALGD